MGNSGSVSGVSVANCVACCRVDDDDDNEADTECDAVVKADDWPGAARTTKRTKDKVDDHILAAGFLECELE